MATVKKTTAKKVQEAVKKTAVTENIEKLQKTQGKTSVGSVKNSVSPVNATLKINILDSDGKAAGTLILPEAIFGAKVNPTLMAQAVRVYLANQRQGNATTKTRGEVDGSTRKIYRQKGTGRARHGGIRAPIFVKGGIAHGPKLRDYTLSMPVKMKRAALFSALTTQLRSGNVIVVAGFEKVGPKTKNMAQALSKLGANKKALVVMPNLLDEIYKAGRNIKGVSLAPAQQLTTYDVLDAGKIVFMKESIEALQKTFVK